MYQEVSSAMPNKTIYIADADMPIFERAQQLAGGNLSATIVQALRRFIETAEAKENDFEEITVRVGSVAPVRKRFVGRLLTEGHTRELRGATRVTYKVYLTRLGKFALSVEDFADLSGSQWWSYKLNNPRAEKVFRFEVFDTVEDLRNAVPQEVYTAVLQTLTNTDGIEILDI